MKILPPNRPLLPRQDVLHALISRGVQDAVCLFASRGYYRKTMGDPTRNDRAMYDDAIFLISPSAFVAFNANTDPSAFRKHIASLQTGIWKYKVGTHGLSKPATQRYTALVQAGEVTVTRDQAGTDTGWFGINIHRGGFNGTSSLGCQTIYPTQWPSFIELVQSELKRAGQKIIPYLLTEEDAI